MAKICDKCHRVHKGECPKPPTPAQMRRKTAKFLRTLEKAYKAAAKSKLRFGISNVKIEFSERREVSER
jgi:hypothetical protein